MELDPAGNVYVAGRVYPHIAVVKYTPDGQLEWVSEHVGPPNPDRQREDFARAIEVDEGGNVWVSGVVYGGSWIGRTTVKYDANGNELWVARVYSSDETASLALDSTGNAFVTVGYWPWKMVKYDSVGSRVWSADLATGEDGKETRVVQVSPEGHLYAAGTMAPDPASPGITDIVLVKYRELADRRRPIITKAPVRQTIVAGSVLSLQAEARSDLPTTFQWLRNGTPVAGATNVLLTINNAQPQHAGQYSIAVSNGAGEIVSAEAAVIVSALPLIELQPAHQSTVLGGDYSFRVYASGTSALKYQWQFNSTAIIGATNDMLTVTNVQPAQVGNYAVVVSSFAGSTTSRVARATVFSRVRRVWGTDWHASLPPLNSVVLDRQGHVYMGDYTRLAALDASGNQLWVTNWPGTLIAITPTDEIIAAGYTDGGDGYSMAQITKFNSAGTGLWRSDQKGPRPGNDFTSGLALGHDQSVYLSATSGPYERADIVTYKFDANGALLWKARYDRPDHRNDASAGIALDSFGNAVVAGATGAAGFTDIIVLKYDSQGNQLWMASFDGAAHGVDASVSVAVDAQNSVYVLGTSAGASGQPEMVTLKYDSGGRLLWHSIYRGQEKEFVGPVGIRLSPDGNAYVTAWTQGTADSGYLAVKYRGEGKELWATRFKPDNVDYMDLRAMAVDAAGNLYLTGYGGTIKLDSEGLLLWSDSSLIAFGIAVSNAGEVYVSHGKYVELASGLQVIERPQHQITSVGSDVTLRTSAVGEDDLRFQWTFNGAAIPFATNAALNLRNIQREQAGKYAVEISDAIGLLARAEAKVTVATLPVITGQPTNFVAVAGATVRFRVDAAGTSPLSYKWRFNGLDLPGATNATLTLTNVQSAIAGDYDVLISSLAGSTRSQSARLSFYPGVAQSWAARFHPFDPIGSYATGLAVDWIGNAYAIGRASTNGGGAGYVTIKYNAQGSELWARLYGESWGNVIEPSAVEVDASGNVHVAGSYLGGPYTTLKYALDGRLLWAVRAARIIRLVMSSEWSSIRLLPFMSPGLRGSPAR
ncbi:MAG: immunoglobulin domain-containing protein [Verrucomicrobiales bacterium]|nr:immunoglobulin domain-containing protein [Verrucomicrobiales bacterium]